MFTIEETPLSGCYLLNPRHLIDDRGSFVKLFHATFFENHGLATDFSESYYSVSHKNVLRGMHFQIPPHAHEKVVSCLTGDVLDVVMDLRVLSPTFGKVASFLLSEKKPQIVYIPKGMAHGFLTLSDSAMMLYNVTTVYAPQADGGILWSSINFQWPTNTPTISPRDAGFVDFANFESPFIG